MTARIDPGYNPIENMMLNLGRILLVFLPLFQAWDKFKGYDYSIGFYDKIGLPAPEVLVILTIALGVVVALMLLFGVAFRFAVVVLAIFLLLDAILANVLSDKLATERARVLFSLDLAAVGACMVFLVTGPGEWSIDGRRSRQS